MALLVKNLRAMWESLGWEDPLEKGKLPTPIFWPREFHGLYSPWGRKSQTLLTFTYLTHSIFKNFWKTSYGV